MDITLYCREKGEGAPLILLHGNGESGEYFEHQIDYFSQRYHVMAVDTRGHGKSPRGHAPFTIRQFAEDLHAFMIGRRIKKACILGFSDGGNIALTFALKWPGMVEKLILNGANLFPSGVKLRVQIPIVLGYGAACLFARRSSKARKNADFLRLMVKEPHISSEQLKDLKVPTLVIAGTNDMIRESHTKLIYRSLPQAELAFVEGDHFIAGKMHERFNARVDVFLSGTEKV